MTSYSEMQNNKVHSYMYNLSVRVCVQVLRVKSSQGSTTESHFQQAMCQCKYSKMLMVNLYVRYQVFTATFFLVWFLHVFYNSHYEMFEE